MTIESDKAYWHRYIDTYERAFATLGPVKAILEFGVFKGDSIRWLAERFPDAEIVGCDIVPQQPSWPVATHIGYVQLDQGEPDTLRALLAALGMQFDLVIEDGSHHPIHQRNCLVEALPYVRPGGLYIVEDLHTSHPSHSVYRSLGREGVVGPLHLLLALEHLQATGTPLDTAIEKLTANSLFSRSDVEAIAGKATSIEIFRRATLPLRCFQCGQSSGFDFGTLRCRCGTQLYGEATSMSALIRV